jgi:hypothetical protein
LRQIRFAQKTIRGGELKKRFSIKAEKLFAIPLSLILSMSLAMNSSYASGYEPVELVPLGNTVGVKLYSDGVIVVGLSCIKTNAGNICPAANAGIVAGDVIIQVGVKKIGRR